MDNLKGNINLATPSEGGFSCTFQHAHYINMNEAHLKI